MRGAQAGREIRIIRLALGLHFLVCGGGADKFRIRIWSGGGLVYDNQLNAPDSDDPTMALGGGGIQIHN